MNIIKFSELECSPEIHKAVEAMGFEETTPIQTLAIPYVMQGRDVVGQAQTGTGKTAAFGIPALDKIDLDLKKPQVLIMCPTRELAVQVSEEMSKLGKFKRGLRILPVYGGQSIDRQIYALKKGVHVIIGTPGRLLDHLKRRTLSFEYINTVVLDEADEMLKMGFREDIEAILSNIDDGRQTLLFSATMPKAILEIISKYQNNPEIVKVAHKELTTPNVSQSYLEVNERNKLEVLTRLIDIYSPKLSIVFCNTKKRVDDVTDMLQARGYIADKIHGDMKQTLRMNVIRKFKSCDVDILVATDVAARGLDIDNVECVFNYDMPSHEEYYVHRVGRTGRAGNLGSAFSFVTGKDFYLLKNIMRYTKKNMQRHQIPTIQDIEVLKKDAFIMEVKALMDGGGLNPYIAIVEELMEENYTSVEIAAAMVKKELEISKERQIDLTPVQNQDKESRKTREKGRGRTPKDKDKDKDMVRLFVNIGSQKKVRVNDLVGAIAGEANIPGKALGSIDIFDTFSFVDVPSKYVDKVVRVMDGNSVKGTKVSCEVANDKSKRKRKAKSRA
ncbi:MAG: DEAD/DEAH box helicase [Clostridia bacterium]|nr:DEAD/DEAH box helicase [Clostridia bacterium]